MKNKEFFYQQYNKLNWENQKKTKLNSVVNNFIIKNIILKHKNSTIKIFDIGFGIGFFFSMFLESSIKPYKKIILEGCEPSYKNYKYYKSHPLNLPKTAKIKVYNTTFQDYNVKEKFDFTTSIYVFPHFGLNDLEKIVQKIYSMLEKKGKFILVVANEKYLQDRLKIKKDLFIESNIIHFNNKNYREILHYSDIPQIGKIIDYNREEQFYLDLFEKNNFKMVQKKDLNDSGFICTLFVFEKSS